MIGENTKKVKEEEKKGEKMPNAYLKFSLDVIEMIVCYIRSISLTKAVIAENLEKKFMYLDLD